MKYVGHILLIFLCFDSIHSVAATTITPITAFQEYFLANYDMLLENIELAAQRFTFLLNANPSPALYPGIAEYLFTTKQYKKLVDLAPSIDTQLPDHLPTQLLILQAQAALQDLTAHNARMARMQERFKKEPEIAIYAIEWNIRMGQAHEALTLLDQVIANAQFTQKIFMFHYLKAQLLLTTGQPHKAQTSAQESVKLQPGFSQGWLLLGLVHEMCGNPHDALASFERCREQMGPQTYIDQQITTLKKMIETEKKQ